MAILAAVVGLAVPTCFSQPVSAQKRGGDMPATFYQSTTTNVQSPARPAAPILDVTASAAAAEAPAGPAACRHAYCNEARNSRLPVSLPATVHTRWRVDLQRDFVAEFVLASDDRILLEGARAWLLLDPAGNVLARDARDPGDLALDPGSGRFFFADRTGYVAAHRMRDGARAFYLAAYSGTDFQRMLIRPESPRVLVVSVESLVSPHSTRPPSVAALELFAIDEPLALSDTGLATSVRRQNYLMTRTARLLAAAQGTVLVLATDDRLYFADSALRLESEFTGEFTPLRLSLDSESRAYLVVEVGSQRMLWVVTRRGERVARVVLPSGFQPIAPPIVGYDRAVYLVSTTRILAVSPAGAIMWDRAVDAPVVGAVVTADRKLLVTSGAALDAYDAQGQRRRLFTAEDDVLVTPAAAAADGDLLVAGRRFVYRLRQ